jgi:ABC-type transport system substrate-binding protein
LQSFPVAQWVTEGDSGKYGISFSYYTYNEPDVLHLLAHSSQFFNFAWPKGMTEGVTGSLTSFDDELDALLEAQRLEFDAAKRTEILKQAQHRINDQAHYVMLWETVQAAVAREGIEGVAVDLVGFIHLQELSKTA